MSSIIKRVKLTIREKKENMRPRSLLKWCDFWKKPTSDSRTNMIDKKFISFSPLTPDWGLQVLPGREQVSSDETPLRNLLKITSSFVLPLVFNLQLRKNCLIVWTETVCNVLSVFCRENPTQSPSPKISRFFKSLDKKSFWNYIESVLRIII